MSQNPSIRRLMKELRDMETSPDPDIIAGPIEDNMFIWHFTIKGPPDSPFAGGHYHGKIIFPTEYPLKPPDIYFLTPNGRFEVNTKICLSATSYHPESWQPSWGIRSLLTALIPFLASDVHGVGAIKMSDSDRKILAKRSRSWRCQQCNHQFDSIDELEDEPEPVPEEDPIITEPKPVVEEEPMIIESEISRSSETEEFPAQRQEKKMLSFIPHVDIPLIGTIIIIFIVIIDKVFPFTGKLFK